MMGLTTVYTITENLRRSITESVSGDVVVYSSQEDSQINLINPIINIKAMGEFEPVMEVIDNNEHVEEFTPQIKTVGLVYNEDEDDYNIPINIAGVNIDNYFDIFKKNHITKGSMIPEGEAGIILNDSYRNLMKEISGKEFYVGDKIKIVSFRNTGSQKIIEVEIFGIMESDNPGFLSTINLMDFETIQKMVGYDAASQVLTVEQMEVLERNKQYMEDSTEEDLFADFGFDEMDETTFDETETQPEVNDTQIQPQVEGTGETDVFILRVTNPNKIEQVVDQLNRTFEEKGIEAKAITYIESSGNIGGFISLIEIVVTAIIFIIQIISIVIITNSVLMGVIERTNEIGTMRAIGAKKNYIFGLILAESFFISVVSAVIGIILAMIPLGLLSIFGLKASNPVMALMFGGEWLYPMITPFNIGLTFVLVIFVTFVANLYPLSIATKVSPIRAMTQV